MNRIARIKEIQGALDKGHPPTVTLRLRVFDVALFILFALGFVWRAANLDYNALFVDEAIYARVGEGFLLGRDPSNALSYMFGSFLYPAISAIAVDVGGVLGARFLSVILSLIAALYVCLSARRLFGDVACVGAAFLFLVHGPSISLGQYAVYDMLSVTLVAAAFYYTLVAALRERGGLWLYWLAGVCFALAILAKYIAIAYLPALAAFVVVGRLRKHGRIDALKRPGWVLAVVAALVILIPYGYINLPNLQQAFTGQFSTQIAPREQILRTLLMGSGLVFLMALVGLRGLLLDLRGVVRSRRLIVLVILLGLGAFVLPIYHLVTSNERALWKHEVYTLVFIAPLAAALFVRVWGGLWRTLVENRPEASLYGVFLVAGAVWLLGSAFVSNRSFHSSWLNFASAIAHLERYMEVEPNDDVLASGAPIYEAYLFPDQPDPNGWQDTWGFNYNGNWGEAAMVAAVQDCALDIVILDDFYTPQVNLLLTPLLEPAGYRLEFDDRQILSQGYSNRLALYVPGMTVACAVRSG
jgi:4-amino-4-deoxy-L-arabinose transferase-like glycosyltransferase